jgi:hypothetical protein
VSTRSAAARAAFNVELGRDVAKGEVKVDELRALQVVAMCISASSSAYNRQGEPDSAFVAV